MYAMHIEGFGIHTDLISIAPYLMLGQLEGHILQGFLDQVKHLSREIELEKLHGQRIPKNP